MPKPQYRALGEQTRHLVEDEKLTHKEVGTRLGLHQATIGRWAKRFGWTTQRSGPRPGERHPGWKGGTRYLKGYLFLYCPTHPHATKQHTVAAHRLIYEAKIGRYLLPSEVVHHIDGDKTNNDPTNLQHFQTNGHHLAHELKGRCPQWSPEGRQRIDAHILAQAAIRRQSRLCGHRYTHTTDRPTS